MEKNAPAKLMSNSTIVYTIEIWHELLGKVKSVETETTEVNINISDLPEGNYVIRLFKNGELETVSNLIIKR